LLENVEARNRAEARITEGPGIREQHPPNVAGAMEPEEKVKNIFGQWERINRKQIARWQHLSWLKARAFLFEIFLLGVKKYNNLYLRFATPSSG
jgi:hypothetical protein